MSVNIIDVWVNQQLQRDKDTAVTVTDKPNAILAFQKNDGFKAQPAQYISDNINVIFSDEEIAKAAFEPAGWFAFILPFVAMFGFNISIDAKIEKAHIQEVLDSDKYPADVRTYIQERVTKPKWYEPLLQFFGINVGLSRLFSADEKKQYAEKVFQDDVKGRPSVTGQVHRDGSDANSGFKLRETRTAAVHGNGGGGLSIAALAEHARTAGHVAVLPTGPSVSGASLTVPMLKQQQQPQRPQQQPQQQPVVVDGLRRSPSQSSLG